MNNNSILTEQDVINTYDERQQNHCKLFYNYKKIKQENQTFGYKKISKLMNEPIHRTRWWHHSKSIPQPILTANWLKEKELIPLTADNPKIDLIAKIIGATFGDGGIFENLNGIFLSSSELEAVKEFGEDLNLVFGKEIEENSRIIEAGVYGHSWCYQNTNRNIIRFFKALGAPIGRKSNTELNIPAWILLENELADKFLGSFFGSEINIPKIHINKTHLDTLSIGFTGSQELENNRIDFLQKIKHYLGIRGIETGKICKSKIKRQEDSFIFKLHISIKLENVIKFREKTKIHYCIYKNKKLEKTIQDFMLLKAIRLNDVKLMGYTEAAAMNLLKINKNIKEMQQ